MLKVIICDDDNNCGKAIEDIVIKFFKSEKINITLKRYADYDDKFMNDITVDDRKIYILDIDTPSRSGIDVARYIRKRDVESVIIFVTGYEEFGKLVLKKNIMCLSFINKFENLKEELTESLREAMHFFETDKVLRITDSNVTYNIRLNSILYITRDSLDRRTIVKCEKNEYRLKINLTDMKELLGATFVQTHRSCYVNKNRIATVDHKNRVITFDNGITVDLLSDTYRKDLK